MFYFWLVECFVSNLLIVRRQVSVVLFDLALVVICREGNNYVNVTEYLSFLSLTHSVDYYSILTIFIRENLR